MIRRVRAPCTCESMNRFLRGGKPMGSPLKTVRTDRTPPKSAVNRYESLVQEEPRAAATAVKLRRFSDMRLCHTVRKFRTIAPGITAGGTRRGSPMGVEALGVRPTSFEDSGRATV